MNHSRPIQCRYGGGKIPHQFRAVSPMTRSSGGFRARRVELNASLTISIEPPDNDTSSRNGNDASSSGQGAPTPSAARISAPAWREDAGNG